MAMNWTNYGGASLWGPDKGAQTSAYQADAAAKEAEKQRQKAASYGAVDEARKRKQFESDRDFQLQVKDAQRKKEDLAIRKGQAEAEKWYNRELIRISKDKLNEDRRQFDLNFAEGQRQFNDTSLFNWTSKAIDLGSRPADWVKYKQYTSGVGANKAAIPGLAWMQGGQLGNTTAQGEHPTASLAGVMGDMGVGTGWAGTAAGQANSIATAPLNLTDQEKQLYQTANDFAANPQMAAAGWYEELDPLTRDLLQGAAQAQGHDWATAQSRWKKSRWGGGAGVMAA